MHFAIVINHHPCTFMSFPVLGSRGAQAEPSRSLHRGANIVDADVWASAKPHLAHLLASEALEVVSEKVDFAVAPLPFVAWLADIDQADTDCAILEKALEARAEPEAKTLLTTVREKRATFRRGPDGNQTLMDTGRRIDDYFRRRREACRNVYPRAPEVR